MAIYFPIYFSICVSFLISRHVGCSGAFFSFTNDPHPAFRGEHYARNAQIKSETATLIGGAMWPDPRERDAATHRSELLP